MTTEIKYREVEFKDHNFSKIAKKYIDITCTK